MGISVIIDSTTKNSVTSRQSITISKSLRAVPTMDVQTVDPDGAYYPSAGDVAEIQDSGDYLFGGRVREVERKRRRAGVDVLTANISCVGYGHALERRLAGQYEFTGDTFKTIVESIVTNSLAGDLTDVTGVPTGPTIDKLTLDLPTVREAFDVLTQLSGFELYVTADNKLVGRESGTQAAPFSVTGTGSNVSLIYTRETLEDLCNVAVARIGEQLLDPAEQTFTGSSPARSFEVTNPIGEPPSIYVNDVEKTVGILGETGKDWYWQDGSKEIRQDEAAAPLTGSDTLRVIYVGITSGFVQASNTASITAYGQHEKLLEIGRSTVVDAEALVTQYVADHKDPSIVLMLETNTYLESTAATIEPGQTLTVNLSSGGFIANGTYLVRSVTLTNQRGDNDSGRWAVRVEAVSGPMVRNLVEVLRGAVGGSGSAVGRPGSGTGGAGVYRQASSTGTTISPIVQATPGSMLVVTITQTSPPGTISFDSDFEVYNTNIDAANGNITRFLFVGEDDGRWHQCAMAITGLTE